LSGHGFIRAAKHPESFGLGGVFFKANDPNKLYEWYEEHHGLKREEGSVNFRWRDNNDAEDIGMTVWALFPKDTKYFDPSRAGLMVNYRVENLDALLDVLRKEGVEIDPRREDYDYGRFAWIMDPEGNRIELWEPPRKAATSCKEKLAGESAPQEILNQYSVLRFPPSRNLPPGASRSHRSRGQRRGAEGAPARLNGNFTQALGTFLRGRIGRHLAALETRLKSIHGNHNEEVHRHCDQHKCDQGVDECAVENGAAVDGERKGGKIGLAENCGDQRRENVGHK